MQTLRIGTRGSPLALAQAREFKDRIAEYHEQLDAATIEIVVIRTTGDAIRTRPLADLGGKGLFTKEIDEALLDGRIDVAVHSMKDVPTILPDGLHTCAYLPREDPRDALISREGAALRQLPKGSVVATSSVRRRAIVLSRRPDLEVVPIRGNVDTRLAKIEAGEADATLLALAGLKRLGREDAANSVLDPDDMLPAVCQGAIGIQTRADDAEVNPLVAAISDRPTEFEMAAERGVLAGLDGDCRTPIAALARLDGDQLSLRALIALPDGSQILETARSGPWADAAAMGADAAAELRGKAGPGFFEGSD